MKKIWIWMLPVLLLLAACSNQAAQPKPGADDAGGTESVKIGEPFAYREITAIFHMTPEVLDKTLGAPLHESDRDDDNYSIEYADATASFYQDGLTALVMRADMIKAPRGIRIGDTLENVLAKFPDDGDDTLYDDEDGGKYRVLYGEYVHMSSYGVLEAADSNTPVYAVADEDFAIYFHFADGKLASIEYRLAA